MGRHESGRMKPCLLVLLAAPVLVPWQLLVRAPLPREHGSDRGYFQHRRAGEEPCQACRDAHADRRAGRVPAGKRRTEEK